MFQTRRIATTIARLAVLGVLLTHLAVPAQAARFDAFLEIDGIDGEAPVGTFDITTPLQPARLGMLLPAVQKVHASAQRSQLLDSACSGAHIPKAKLTCRKTGGDGDHYLVIELEDLVVTSLTLRADEDMPMEEFSLVFSKVQFTWPESGETYAIECRSGICGCTR